MFFRPRVLLPILCVCCLSAGGARAQTPAGADSLTAALRDARGATRMELCLDLARLFTDNEPEESHRFATEALRLADTLRNAHARTQAMNLVGLYHFNRGRFETALEYFLQVLRAASDAKDTANLSNAYTNLGHVYIDLKQFDRAMQYYERDLALARATRDSASIAAAYNNIATVHAERGETASALDAYTRAKGIAEHAGDLSTVALIVNNLGDFFYTQRVYDSALTHFQEARVRYEALADKYNLAIALHNIGLVYRETRRYPDALRFLMQSYDMDKALGANPALLADSRELAETYARMKDFRRAYAWQMVHDRITDSVFTIQQTRRIAELEQVHADQAHEAEFETLKRDRVLQDERLRYSVTLRNVLLGGFMLVLVLIGLVTHRYRFKRRSEEAYRARTEDLEIVDRLVKVINREVSLEQLYRSLLDQVRVIFPQASSAAILMLDDVTGDFRVISSSGLDAAASDALVLTAPILSNPWIAHVERVEKLRDGITIFHFSEAAAAGGLLPRERMIIDIEIDGALTGIMLFDSRARADVFRVPDLERWLRFREHALSAIIKAKLLEDTQRARVGAEEASSIKTRLLSIASHDLKNPLGVVIGIAEIIETESANDEKTRELAGMISDSGNRMLSLLHDLMDTTDLEMGRIMLNMKLTNIGSLVESVVHENQPLAERKQQQIFYTFESPEQLLFMADGKRLREAIANFVDNAIKFSPKGMRIWVRVSKPDKIRIEVRDEGPGLTEQDMEAAFGQFQRLSARPTGGESSSGIGLSIVKQVVEMHGGRTWVERAPEGGAAFCIEL
jgi:signal transduction histidine kinase/tetratricopeptide (TPR) repeat protein